MLDIYTFRVYAGMSIKGFCETFCVSERTYRNWMKKEPPRHIVTCLRLLAGDLSFLSSKWKGFKIYEGDLWTPEGDRFIGGDVRAVYYNERTIHFLSNRVSNLKSSIKNLKVKIDKPKFHFDLPANEDTFSPVDSSSCRLFTFPPRSTSVED